MSSNKHKWNTGDSTPQHTLRSFRPGVMSPPHGPDPEDSGWWATNRTYPIVAMDAIVKPWTEEGLREAMMGEIRALDNWVSVDIFRRGVSLRAAECPPTIVVTIVPGTLDEGCKVVAEKVKDHIERYNLDAAVELIEGTVERYKVLDDVKKSVGMGASIALADPMAGTGTLGGYVQLESPENGQKICALTCHHVVTSKDSSSKDVFENGVRPGCLETSGRLVESPSKEDIDDSFQAWISYLDDQQERLNETREEIEGGTASDTRIGRLEGEIKAVKEASERVRGLENFDRRLGRVLASSGYSVASTGCALDWGLVEVNEERLAGNLLKTVKYAFAPHTDRVEETCKLGKDSVYKFGRSTGFTEGCWSYLQSEVHLPDSPHETVERAFLANRSRGQFFADHGDSGAWVLNREGQLAGLIVGGNPQLRWVYATPISAVFADIEAQLGCKVSLPTAE